MPYFTSVGDVPRKRHTRFRQPDGSLYREELIGEEGFVADSSLLYHRGIPSEVVAVAPGEAVPEAAPGGLRPNHPMRARHLRPHELASGGDLVTSRHILLGNDDVLIGYAAADAPSPLYRNAVGDELVYIESGAARFESVFGWLEADAGDYVIVPASTTHRWIPLGEGPVRALVIEAAGHVRPPRRYLSAHGQFLENSPYCELDLRLPRGPLLDEGENVDVLMKTRAGFARYTMATHPFDVAGWFGCLYPYAFNVHDFEPVTGSLHRPPPVHQTFEGPNFVVCSFVPRLFDYHPEAVPVPPWHANVDSDEVLFYAQGDFMSRAGSGIGQGSLSLHPAGFVHGPHPGSVEAALGALRTEEVAVMIDTFRPLNLGAAATPCEDDSYTLSWHRAATGA
ncbi:homogentisate 1,2-dioxygenase [Actinomadura macra]|uniref:homogentisate 1,2-dioxygenase n=1 Tax=Actinomadura macra TaxID=46164 RepID=UPI00082A3F33|nr:cupin domain-containing protein [Actinomadura macra]